jgi:hypothetical protein
MPVRRTLATTLTLLALLSGCGDGSSDGTGSTVSAGGPSEPAAVRATLVHATAGKGAVSDRVSVLEDAAAVQQYAAGFSPVLAARIMRAARSLTVPAGQVLVAGVVAVGCDVPPGARASGSGAEVTLTAAPVPSPRPECFAPVTTVALAVVPA